MRFLRGILLSALLVFSGLTAFGQSRAQAEAEVLRKTDQKSLSRLANRLAEQFRNQQERVQQLVAENGLTERQVFPDGRVLQLMGVNDRGFPIYYTTFNDDAAESIGTNELHPGGATGLNLIGTGLSVGAWDGGATRTSHQEFGSRAAQVDGSGMSLDDHATHVGGTMISAGQFQAASRGMAYDANLDAYDWNSDGTEMATAAGNGLLLSNHSYGTPAGWENDGGNWRWYGDTTLSGSEDYNFGRYNNRAASWDQISRDAPFYLIVKAAGNDRNDDPGPNTPHEVIDPGSGNWVASTTNRPGDGNAGYDCIPTYGCAKNILTVGAVQDVSGGYSGPGSVNLSGFTGWGPTDDGRIKPDVVSNGVGLYSTGAGNNSDYMNMTGTSMAAPSVTGSLLLLQEHAQNTLGSYLLSTTLKALVIHTADDGDNNPGPDYRYGWGLVDVEDAANRISNFPAGTVDRYFEDTLADGNTASYNLTANGVDPIVVTIVWDDVPGTPVAPAVDDPTAMLVNDLDIRLEEDVSGNITAPYVLDPANPSNAPTTGDNFRDNVEKIVLASPSAGNYTINVTHKGTLSGGFQAYSIIISGGQSGAVPSADFGALATTICPGGSVQFNDLSSGGPTSWSWEFPGGTPSNSNSPNPTVTYNAPGTYDVQLTVSNVNGTDSITQTGFITVINTTPLPFTEDFENGFTAQGWSVQNPDGGSITWDTTAVGGNSPGNFAAWMNHYSYNTVGHLDALNTPVLDFSGYDSVRMTFEHAYQTYSGFDSDTLIFQVSDDCGASFTTLGYLAEDGTGNWVTQGTVGTTADFTPSTANDWCGNGAGAGCYQIDLSAYDNTEGVIVRFLSLNVYSNNLYIDNVNITGVPLFPEANFTASATSVCEGASIDFSEATTGGTPTSYNWSFPGGTPASSTAPNPTGITYNAPGTYPVTLEVSNSFGADTLTQTGYIVVNQNPSVSVVASQDVTCNGGSDGSAVASATGGTGPYNYNWQPGNISSDTASGLAAGNYTVTVLDVNGCSATATQNITEPASAVVISVDSQTDPLCNGGNDGEIQVSATGGAGNFDYELTPTSGSPISNATGDFTGLAADTYTLTATDADGCQDQTTVTLNDPAGMSITITELSPVSCFGAADGSLSVSVTGGSPGYTYSWSPNSSTNDTVTGLAPMTYTVTVTDANNCAADESYTLNEPLELLAQVQTMDVTCFGAADGSAMATATGGTAPYNFTWNTTPPTTGANLTGLGPGAYQVTVTDANNCTTTADGTVNEPDSLSLTVSVSPDTTGMATGAATANVSGGTVPYNYQWSTTPPQTTPQATGLSAGTYYVTVTDSNGCTVTDSAVVIITSAAPYADGKAIFRLGPNPSNGSAELVYQLPEAGQLRIRVMSLEGKVFSVEELQASRQGAYALPLQGLAAGTYLVEVGYGSTLETFRLVLQR